MASVLVGQTNRLETGPALLSIVRENGTASHRYASSEALLIGPASSRNLADAIHLLCALHGRQPGVIEMVAMRIVDPEPRASLAQAAEAFARERAYLGRLAVEAGPVPPTPGTGSEATIAMQRSAVMTLAQSERRGCAIGAALALAADWAALRTVLDVAAARFGISVPTAQIGDPASVAAIATGVGEAPAVARALYFGAEQVALQHRGLWDLLEARQLARSCQPA